MKIEHGAETFLPPRSRLLFHRAFHLIFDLDNFSHFTIMRHEEAADNFFILIKFHFSSQKTHTHTHKTCHRIRTEQIPITDRNKKFISTSCGQAAINGNDA
jgi:hypothetical protein